MLSGGVVFGGSEPVVTETSLTPEGELRIDGSAPAGAVCTLQRTPDLGAPFADIAGSGRAADADGKVTWIEPLAGSSAFYRICATPGRQLLTWADLEAGLVGAFAVPMAEEGDFRFGYSSGVHAQLGNGNLLVVGHPYFDRQAEVALPDTLDGREGTRVGDWIDITAGLLPSGWEDGPAYLVGGMLEVGDRIHFTKYQWYNGSGADWQTQGVYEGGYDGGGATAGMWTVDNPYAHHSRVAGYLSYPPAALQPEWTYLAGLSGTSGAALGRWGPNLFAIDPTPMDGKVRAATLICHDSESHQAPEVAASNATSDWWVVNSPANRRWWIANKVTDLKWIETENRHGVVGFVYRGLGQTWYGLNEASPGLPDPYDDGGSGFHAEGWALEVWIYDPEDLMAVYRAERDPWSLAPVEVVLLSERLPGVDHETHYSFFTGAARTELNMSFRGNRLIILQAGGYVASEWENTPRGYVFEVP